MNKFIWMRAALATGCLATGKPAFAGRALTLFWERDVALDGITRENAVENRLSLTQTLHAPAESPCFYLWEHAFLLFADLQLGLSCAVRTGDRHFLAIDARPEVAFRKGNQASVTFRPAVATSLTESYQLGDGLDGHMVYASFHYKFAPLTSENVEPKVKGFAWETLPMQKWNDIFQTYYSLGWLRRRINPLTGRQTSAYSVNYREAIPLEIRRVGAMESSASVTYKALEAEGRWGYDQFIIGGGIGYLILAVDQVRVSFPYPLIMVGYDF